MPTKVLHAVKNWQNWNPWTLRKSGPYGLIGSGPFMFDEYRPGEYIMMKRNGHYRIEKKSVKTQ